MTQDSSRLSGDRTELPIERGFPIERVNEIAAKEGRARRHYRPIYTMHKWWARRLGCIFRTVSLYSLLDDPSAVEVLEPGGNETLGEFGGGHSDIATLIDNVDIDDPESLWELYPKDVRIQDKKVLDPFMGGGTSLVEASRFGAEVVGNDLNPVAWFSTKKELEAGQTDPETLRDAFDKVKEAVADELKGQYKTPCPNCDGEHDADVMYYFWVKEVDCVSCEETVSLFKDCRVGKGRYGNDGYDVHCPECGSITHTDDWHSETSCGADDCMATFVPDEGTVSRGGKYACPHCGQKYGITDAIQEQDGFETRLFALEYYCPTCDQQGRPREETKGYLKPRPADFEAIEDARQEWVNADELKQYVPDADIRSGSITASSSLNGNDVFQHGYTKWADMFNERQLLCLSKLLRAIDDLDDQNAKEYLLMTFSNALCTNSTMVPYQTVANKIDHIFRSNSFDPPMTYAENNLWGTDYGRGTFTSMWDMVTKAVEYAHAPTDRYMKNGEMVETPPFETPIGENATVTQGDSRRLDAEDEYDAVLTDPPYYDNIIYSELSDYFYVWQKLLLEDEYDAFQYDHTPRAESIVANPAEGKDVEVFESELHESFDMIHTALKDDGVLAFTYHHSDSESWGELLEALCDVGFEVTATYPITADVIQLTRGESVEFDIIIVARPATDREPVSWNSLRRQIVRTAKQTHQQLTDNRELSDGNIGVIEMGRAFHEYSKHHGEVRRDGEIMTAKEVVDEIYGIIQQGSDIGEVDVFLDLLEMSDPSYSDLNMLTRGTSANPDEMKETLLYRMEDGEFVLGTWDDEKRQAYIQERANGISDTGLTPLDKAQFLRHRYEHGQSIQNYLKKWTVSDELRELCQELAAATDDDVYTRILGGDRALGDY